jgi:deferrochelatase/peroxidase EfeB
MGMRGRAHLAGDVGPHAPEHWEGGLGGPDIHAMGWIRTDSDEGLEEATRVIRAEMEATGGVAIQFVQDTKALAHENGIGSEGEHFGFADPISQPPIEGADAPMYPGDGVLEADGTWRALKPGEFLLGYEDEAGAEGVLAPEPFELRLNGTYVVFRKLYQDVAAFRRYLGAAAKSLYVSDDPHHQELVAAKMMGRWRSGCPIDLSPDKDDPAIAADPNRRNNFTYAGDDEGRGDSRVCGSGVSRCGRLGAFQICAAASGHWGRLNGPTDRGEETHAAVVRCAHVFGVRAQGESCA